MAVNMEAERTFLMTDIEGSTRLWEADPSVAAAVVARHDDLVKVAVEAHNGVVPKGKGEGDSFLGAFDDPADAVAAAVAIQESLQSDPLTAALKVRVAIHHGPAQSRGGDFFGPTLNRTARLRSVAHGGQILLSEAVADLARKGLPSHVKLTSLGIHRLRDLSSPEHIYQATSPTLTPAHPPLFSLGSPSALPAHPTRFFDRQSELSTIQEMIADFRVVSLAGPAGVGKTRLAVECASRAISEFQDGIWFVDLSSASAGGDVFDALASVFAVSQVPGVPLEDQIRERLRGRRLLVILDNCEQVVAAVAELVHRTLKESPEPKFLTTTRESLDIPGEAVFFLDGLPTPSDEDLDPEHLLRYDAVMLFSERARLRNASFAIDSANAAAVKSIVRRLDGIPLAIELAASRAAVLSPVEIDRRLADRLHLLATTARTLAPRQRSIRGAIDWSFDLLDEGERRAFMILSLFAGSIAVEAAENVVADEYAIERLASLVNKSLIAASEGRFRMLESIRAYAAEKLSETEEIQAAEARHTRWFKDLAEDNASKLRTRDQSAALEALDIDYENLRAALSRSIAANQAEDALRISSAMWRYWYIRGTPSEGRRWLEQSIAIPGGTVAARAKAMIGLGGLAQLQGDLHTARGYFEQARAVFQELGDEVSAAVSLNNLGNLTFNLGDLEKAEQYLHESLNILRRKNRLEQLSTSLNNLGAIAQLRGKSDQAAAFFKEALQIAERGGDRREVARSLILSGRSKDASAGRLDHERAFAIASELGDLPVMANALSHIAHAALEQGEAEIARERYAQALQISGDLGDLVGIAYAELALAGIVADEDPLKALAHARRAAEAAERANREDYLQSAEQIVTQLSDAPPRSS